MNKRIIHSVFENQASNTPDHPAVVHGDRSLTYDLLNRLANRLAHVLREIGIGRGKIVGSFLPSGPEQITALLGIFKSAGIYMPLDLGLSAKNIQQALSDSDTSVCVTDTTWFPEVKTCLTENANNIKYMIVLAPGQLQILSVQDDFEDITSQLTIREENPDLINDPEDGNYIFYTSGSTGVAKAILGKHDSLSHCIHWEMSEFEVNQEFRIAQLSQSTFDASLRDILVPLCAGATLVVPGQDTKDNLSGLLAWMAEEKINLFHTVPSVFRALIKELQSNRPMGSKIAENLKHVLLAGEPLYVKDILAWRQSVGNGPEVVNLYGATEATMFKTYHRIDNLPKAHNAPIHAGKPISNALIGIINEGRICNKGEIGEIYIITPFLSKGYFNDQQKTLESFVQNPLVEDRAEIVYKTGDFGRYLDDGNFEVLGRTDDQVKINGIRVELNEIKEAVHAYPQIKEAELIVQKGDDLENALICYYVGDDVDEDDLNSSLEKILNRSLLPTLYVKMDEFPLTINGKVDKRALPKPEKFLIKDGEYEETVGATESSLELMCLNILGLSRMGRKVSFFKAGGTSLKAMQYISRIHQKFGVSINLRDVFEKNTVEKLAAHLDDLVDKGVGYQTITVLDHQPHYELSHAQKRLWLADQFEGDKSIYNMSYASHIRGEFDLSKFQDVINCIVERHEILRTSFQLIDGEPRQTICQNKTFVVVEYNDIRISQCKQTLINKHIIDEMHAPFNLTQGPLFRARVVQSEDDEFIVILSMHHIVADGWSLEVIQKECFELYSAFAAGGSNPLVPLRIQYKDYCHWQNRLLEEEQVGSLEKYWLNQMSGDIRAIELPADYSPLNKESDSGSLLTFEFDTGLTEKVQQIARANEATLFMVLTALTNLFLAKFSGYDEVITGTPSGTRKHPELEGQVGVYINILPLRIRSILGKPDFKALLTDVKGVIVDAFENDLYPYDLLIEKLGLIEDRSRFPLINVLIQSQDMFVTNLAEVDGLTITNLDDKCRTSKVDLTFNFKQEENQILAAIEYNQNKFSESTINYIKDNLMYLVEEVAQDMHKPLSEIDLLLDQNQEQEQDEFMASMMGV